MNLQIAIVISFFGLCVTMPIFVRYFAYMNAPFWTKSISFIVCCLVAILPIFASRNWTEAYGKYFSIIEHTLYFIYIFAVLLFALTFIRDVIWFFLYLIKMLPNPFNPVIFTKANIITFFLTILCASWSLYEGMKVPNEKHVFLSSSKLTEEKTVVVLSDLHISRTISPDKIQAIIDRTNHLHPDLILLAGDILDDDIHTIRHIANKLSQLKAKKGVYFVSGNHEFYIGYERSMQTLKALGLTSLENKKMAIEPNFYLAGVSDIPTSQRFLGSSKAKSVLSDIPLSAYTLFVSHSPVVLDLPFDLQVSGHTHGGQIFPFHFFSWLGNHHLLAGFYPEKHLYISRGSGQWGPQMRFLAPSEITVLHLKQKK